MPYIAEVILGVGRDGGIVGQAGHPADREPGVVSR